MKYQLDYGVQHLTIATGVTVLVRVGRDEMHVDHVMMVIDGRDAGSFSGTLDQCEVWAGGWIAGWVNRDGRK
jgi:hypothetical protein